MTIRKLQKILRRVKKQLRSTNRRVTSGIIILVLASILIYMMSHTTKRLSVDPESYGPLLQLIAEAESNDNYNAYFGSADNTTINFTDMTIQEVLDWQDTFVANGSPSSAVGRYQIINTTLEGLIEQRDVDKTTGKFDQTIQDQFAISLLERRGSEKYINNDISAKDFAANLAMEWAALPKTTGANPNDSYYAGDGLNSSSISIDALLEAISSLKAASQ